MSALLNDSASGSPSSRKVENWRFANFTKFFISIIGVALIAAGITAGSAKTTFAATINVPADYATIQAAVTAASPTDTIVVAAGTYHEQLTINKALTINGADGAILDGTGLIPTWTTGVIIKSGNVTFNNIDVLNFTQDGIVAYRKADMPNIHITNCKVANIQPGNWGFGIYVGYESEAFKYTGPSQMLNHLDFSGLLIEGNEVVNTHSSAVVVQSITGTPGTLVVRNNYIHGGENDGIWIDCARNIVIRDNVVENNTDGIYISSYGDAFIDPDTWTYDWNNQQLNGPYGPKNIQITGNQIAGNVTYGGIYLQAGYPATIFINSNSITGNTPKPGVANNLTEDVDATGNWWGSSTGPSSVGLGLGDPVSTNVNYTPWLNTANINQFWVATTGSDSNDGSLALPFQTIQKAIDSSANGYTINVAAGTYNEAITVTKPLTLNGANAGISPGDPARGPESIVYSLNYSSPSTFNNTAPVVIGTLISPITGINSPTNLASPVTVAGFSFSPNPASTVPVRKYGNRGTEDNGVYVNTTGAAVNIKNNIISNYWDNGIRVIGGTVSILNNNITGRAARSDYSGDGVRVDGTSIATITGNIITSNIYTLLDGVSGGLSLNWGATVSATGNIIHDNTYGIHIKGGGIGHAVNTTANYNSIYNNVTMNFYYQVQSGGSPSSPYDATRNWWGSADGSTIATKISGPVNYSPWLGNGTDTETGTPGFQPDLSVLGVGPGTPGGLQAIINSANPGDTINVAAGTYAGNITINKSLTIIGNPGDAGPGPGTGAPVIDGGNAPGDGFRIANGVSNVTIKGFEIRNFTSSSSGVGNGVQAWQASTSNITIQDNYFHNLGWNGVLVGNDLPFAGSHTGWTIKANILETFEYYGFELTNTSNSSIESNVIHSDLVSAPVSCIMVLAHRNESGITIKGNTIDGAMPAFPTAYAPIFVAAGDTGGGVLGTPNLDNVVIENNLISASGGRAHIYLANYTGGTVTGVHAHGNSFTSFRNSTPAAVDATGNWWGTNNGATIASQITGSGSALVDYTPWVNLAPGSSTANILTFITNNPGTPVVLAGTYTGDLSVPAGVTVMGDFTVTGSLTLGTGATLSPGYSPGIINSGNLTLVPGSNLNIQIDGPVAGTGYDQVNVTGTVNLGGATLNVTTGYSPGAGTSFVIVNNDGTDDVTGTFAGLPQNATFDAGGTTFQISYAGGDGNDVVLTAVTGTCPTISTPVVTSFASPSAVPVTIPVSTTSLTDRGVISTDFTFTYDPAVMTPVASPGTATAGTVWIATPIITTSVLTPGTLKVSIYDGSNLPAVTSGAGTLVNLHFNVIGSAGTATSLAISNFLYNGGMICTEPPSNGSLTVVKADQTINVGTPAPANAQYRDTFGVVATATSGLPVAITTSGSCSGSGSGSATVTMISGTGTCTVLYNQLGNGYYNAAPQVTSPTTATKAPLTVTASSHTVAYGDPVPTITPTYATLLNGDLPAVITGQSCTTSYTVLSAPGSLQTTSCSGGSATNYQLSYVAGTVTITTGTINGRVLYSIPNALPTPEVVPVPGVVLDAPSLTAPDVTGTTDVTGLYSLTNFGAGAYRVTPFRTPQACDTDNGIEAYDASLVARHVVGIAPGLSLDALLAGKVSGTATAELSSYDAALIARFVVGLCTGPNISGQWFFTPAYRDHASVSGAPLTEDYTAYMMGDVDGSWVTAASPGRPAPVDPTSDRGRDAVRASVPNAEAGQGSVVTVPFSIGNLQGRSIDSYQFNIEYDPTVLEPVPNSASGLGTLSSELSVISNAPQPGLLKVAVYGVVPVTGEGVYVNLRFRTIGSVGSTSPMTIDGFRFDDGRADYTVVNGMFTVTAASASASVHGRLLTAGGQGVRNARVVLTSTTGARFAAITGAFGYYEFTGLTIGETYTVSVEAKRYTFSPRTFSVTETAVELDMIADQ